MPLTNGSGSFYFRHWPSRRQQKTSLKKKFFCLLFFEGTFTVHHFSKIKSHEKNQGFSYYFCLMIEGSGSGTWMRKNMRIRIRIRNTGINMSCLPRWIWWRWGGAGRLPQTQPGRRNSTIQISEKINTFFISVPDWQAVPVPRFDSQQGTLIRNSSLNHICKLKIRVADRVRIRMDPYPF